MSTNARVDLAEPYDTQRERQAERQDTLRPAVTEFLLSTAVRMAEVKTPGRDEATLGEIAQRLGELGELHLLRSLNCHRERFQTCLNMMK